MLRNGSISNQPKYPSIHNTNMLKTTLNTLATTCQRPGDLSQHPSIMKANSAWARTINNFRTMLFYALRLHAIIFKQLVNIAKEL